ncbi:MAG: hypothetical protein RI897_3699 [Verrucomicrobiota bacterium]
MSCVFHIAHGCIRLWGMDLAGARKFFCGVMYVWGLFSEQEFATDEEEEGAEGAFEVCGLDFVGEPGAEPASGDSEGCDGEGGSPVDIACAGVLPGSDDGGGDDDAEGGADGLFEVTDGWAEEEGHGGDHDDTATDSEESAGDAAE